MAFAAAVVIAFAHRDGEVEGIGIAVEISRPTIRAGQFDKIFRSINAVLAASFQEAAGLIALLQPGDLPRTSSGKLRRSSCAAMLASGELQPAAVFRRGQDRGAETGRPETEAEKALVAIWMSVLGLSAVGVDDNFFEMGGQSVAAIHLVARIAEAFGRDHRCPLRLPARDHPGSGWPPWRRCPAVSVEDPG